MAQATLEILADSSQIRTAEKALDDLASTGSKTESAAQRVERKFTDLNKAAKSAAASASAFSASLTTVNQDLSESRSNLENFISDQIKFGRTIDENGNVLSASGVRMDELSDDLARLKNGYINTANQADELADSMSRITLATDKNQAASQDAAMAQSRLEAELKQTEVAARAQARALGTSTVNATKSSASMAHLSRNAGMAGIQVQQFVGQIQGGQSAMLALSQQSADLGFVLGQAGLGAAIGITATAISFLMMDSDAAKTSVDRLEDSLDSLSNTASLGASGLIEYTQEIERLAQASQLAAAGRVEAAIKAANDAAKDAAKSVTEEVQEQLDLDGFFADLEGAVASVRASLGQNLRLSPGFGENIAVAEKLAEKLGITGDNARQAGAELVELIAATELDASPESFVALSERLTELRGSAGIVAKSAIDDLLNAIGPLIDKGILAGETAKKLGKDLQDGIVDTSGEASKETEKLTANLQAQVIAMESGAQAAEVYAATQAAVANGTEEQLPEIIALINRKYELKRAQEEAAEAAKTEAAAQRQLEKDYQSFLQRLAEGEALRKRQEEQDAKSFANLKQQLVLQQQQFDLTSNEFELRRNLLALGEDDGSELYQKRAEEITALTGQLQAMRFEAELVGRSLEQSMGDIGVNALDSVSQGLASIITQGESAREVFHSIANTILNELLTAVIRYAIGAAAQSIIGTTTASAASVAAGATVAAAWTPAAIAASIATAGGATTAGVAAISAGAPIAAGAIKATSLAGFESGGYTGNVGTSSVAGVVHGQEYVMPADVTRRNRPALEAMHRGESIGGDTYVNVVNNSSNTTVETQESTNSDGARVVDIVVADINRRGRIHQSLVRTTTANNRL